MADQPQQSPEPGTRLLGGRWPAGTLVQTPRGERGLVLPYEATSCGSAGSDSVFVRLLATPERPWLLISSSELTAVPENEP